MAQFTFDGRGRGQWTYHETTAMRNIYHAFNWIVGGWYNTLEDYGADDLPDSIDRIKDEVYDSAMTEEYGDGYVASGRAPKEMRFAGERFCREYIDWKFDNDGDVKVLAAAIARRDGK